MTSLISITANKFALTEYNDFIFQKQNIAVESGSENEYIRKIHMARLVFIEYVKYRIRILAIQVQL